MLADQLKNKGIKKLGDISRKIINEAYNEIQLREQPQDEQPVEEPVAEEPVIAPVATKPPTKAQLAKAALVTVVTQPATQAISAPAPVATKP